MGCQWTLLLKREKSLQEGSSEKMWEGAERLLHAASNHELRVVIFAQPFTFRHGGEIAR